MVHLAPDPPVIPEDGPFAAAIRDLAPMECASDPGPAQVALSRHRAGRDGG
jgi:hypothetical protein